MTRPSSPLNIVMLPYSSTEKVLLYSLLSLYMALMDQVPRGGSLDSTISRLAIPCEKSHILNHQKHIVSVFSL